MDSGVPFEEDGLVMAVTWHKNHLAYALFNGERSVMQVGESVEERDFWILRKLFFQLDPKIVVVPSKSDEVFMKVCEPDEENPGWSLRCLKSKEFDSRAAKYRLCDLRIGGIDSTLPRDAKLHLLSSIFNIDSDNLTSCIGGLLVFLLRSGLIDDTRDQRGALGGADSGFLSFQAIERLSLHDMLEMDAITYSALQILPVGDSMEGDASCLNLYNHLNKTKSPSGRKLLRLWMLQPTRSLDILHDRYNAVGFFGAACNSDLVDVIRAALSHTRDVARILRNIQKASAGISDWRNLQDTMKSILEIRGSSHMLSQRTAVPQALKELHQLVSHSNVQFLVSGIDKVINFDESKRSDHIVVNYGVHDQLDEMKRNFDGLGDFLTRVAVEEARYSGVRNISFAYFPQVGYLVGAGHSGQASENTAQQQYPSDWDFRFEYGDRRYYKCTRASELDEQVGDLYNQIIDVEHDIMRDVEASVLQEGPGLIEMSHLCAEMDCLISFSVVAREYGYTLPAVGNNTRSLCIQAGRHPLQEQVVPTFVPNDTVMGTPDGENDGFLQVVSGPNCSGKSVYAKQVAMICYMAHIGSFVPAESASIPLLDRIFTRVHSLESITVNKSSFMIDLNQISTMLRNCTPSSLLISDEFAKGTSAEDGVCLASAFIQYMVNLGDQCPKTVVSTHFTETFEKQYVDRNHRLIQPLVMDVHVERSRTGTEGPGSSNILPKDITFLYKIRPGLSSGSFGVYCAYVSGIPEQIIERALQISRSISNNERIKSLSAADNTNETNEENLSILNSFLALPKDATNECILEFARAHLFVSDQSTSNRLQ